MLSTPFYDIPGKFAAGSTPVINARILDASGNGVPSSDIDTLTLSIVDVLSGVIINGVDQTNILNVGRGVVDGMGNLTLSLEAGDTSTDELPGVLVVRRGLVIDWTSGASVGRSQLNMQISPLAGP